MTSTNSSLKERNNRNRRFGKAVEYEVAKLCDSANGAAQRVPGSGAFKFSNKNLTGDVQVRDASGNGLMKIECKGVSTITAKGEKTYTFKKSVIDQAFQEADLQGEIGVLWIHFLHNNYRNDDYVVVAGDAKKGESHGIIQSHMFLELLELAKLGAVVRDKGVYP